MLQGGAIARYGQALPTVAERKSPIPRDFKY
jgi:hypothetical protein